MKHEFLVRFAEKFQLASSSSKQEQAKYLGSKGKNFLWIKIFKFNEIFFKGEIRVDTPSELVHVAIASEGVSLSSKSLLASGIVQHAFGTIPKIKWSDGSSRIARASLSLATEPAAVNNIVFNN
jgi:hypothetical protein